MDHPGAGGAVVVAVEAAGARPLGTRVSVRVTRARAGAAPPPAGAASALVAPVAEVARAPTPSPAWTRDRLSARRAFAVALSLLGCVAAVLAFVAMILPLAGTEAGVASLRTASQYLLVAAAAQMLAAAMGLLVPVAIFGTALMGVLLTTFHTSSVLEMQMLLATTSCHGSAHGAVSLL